MNYFLDRRRKARSLATVFRECDCSAVARALQPGGGCVFLRQQVWFFLSNEKKIDRKSTASQLKKRKTFSRAFSLFLVLSLPLSATISPFSRARTCHDHQAAHGDGKGRHSEVESDGIDKFCPRRQRACRLDAIIGGRGGRLSRGHRDGHF